MTEAELPTFQALVSLEALAPRTYVFNGGVLLRVEWPPVWALRRALLALLHHRVVESLGACSYCGHLGHTVEDCRQLAEDEDRYDSQVARDEEAAWDRDAAEAEDAFYRQAEGEGIWSTYYTRNPHED